MGEIKIPCHWQMKKLGEIADYYNGRAFKPIEWEKNGKPIIRIQNLNNNDAIYNFTTKEFEDRFKIENGQLLYAWSASLGTYIWNGQDAWLNQHIFKVIPRSSCDKKFLFYALEKITAELYSKTHGSGMVHVTNGKFKETEIPFPPLLEQIAIVSKIEELLSDLENGKQQLLLAQQQLKVYRQSLLSITTNKSDTKTIGSVIEKLDQGWSPRCLNENSKDNDEWAVIKTTAVQHGFFLPNENKILPTYLAPRVQHELKVGDILITRAGPRIRVGVCCMVRYTRPKLINCDKVYRIRVKTKIIKPEYLELLLNSPSYLKEIEKMKSGISDSGVNLTQSKFLKIEIPIPSIEEQNKIVSELETKLTVCNEIEEIINSSLQQSETLKQSILKKAFEGKLVNTK